MSYLGQMYEKKKPDVVWSLADPKTFLAISSHRSQVYRVWIFLQECFYFELTKLDFPPCLSEFKMAAKTVKSCFWVGFHHSEQRSHHTTIFHRLLGKERSCSVARDSVRFIAYSLVNFQNPLRIIKRQRRVIKQTLSLTGLAFLLIVLLYILHPQLFCFLVFFDVFSSQFYPGGFSSKHDFRENCSLSL